ncbi:DUF3857 domain-containing protein [Mangrovibacterium lignilyticum]|uniref:DUF3857 domain-containing protein n=1 Tax=Mangrovibacterium lignilyticum TaxID=2668052 RepID=UPI0013D4078B|nr:DUF3857 domain-containing transglutaminase family protein [Mangrovibacterium lignilyticum]
MRHCNILLLILLCGFQLSAQESYTADQIPDSLKENAWAVIRSSQTEYTRTSLNKYSMDVHKIITILNPKGERYSSIAVYYDDDSEITSLKGSLYDANGDEINTIRKNDFSDEATNNSFTLLSDNRVKYYEPSVSKYPYTIAYSYRVEYKSIISFTNWIPCESFHVAVESARLTVRSPDEFEIRHKSRNYAFDFEEDASDGQTTLSWSASNLKASKYDYGRPGYLDIFPVVEVMPTQFSYDGFDGDFSSWKSYGQWVYQLLAGRDELSEQTIAEIEQLTATAKTEKEKVKLLYRYLQQKTRYVNISFGIGGFRPMFAKDVDEKGYGDCKALSNYMRSLLKQAGIRSYYAEIGHGLDQKIQFPDFPSATQTNHVILCVPTEQDTTWLECTSQHIPFGYIGAENSDRYALLITEDGGRLAKTPVYDAENNLRQSAIELLLDESGTARIKVNADFKNAQFENIFGLIHRSKDDQKKALLRGLDAHGLELADYVFTDLSDSLAEVRVDLSGKLVGITAKAGSRLLVKPNFLFSNEFPEKISLKRTSAVYEPVGYEYNDSLVFQIPDAYAIEFVPKETGLKTDYGSCQYNYRQEDGKVIIQRNVRINKGNYPPEKFTMVNLFLAFCEKMDNTQFILKKL